MITIVTWKTITRNRTMNCERVGPHGKESEVGVAIANSQCKSLRFDSAGPSQQNHVGITRTQRNQRENNHEQMAPEYGSAGPCAGEPRRCIVSVSRMLRACLGGTSHWQTKSPWHAPASQDFVIYCHGDGAYQQRGVAGMRSSRNAKQLARRTH